MDLQDLFRLDGKVARGYRRWARHRARPSPRRWQEWARIVITGRRTEWLTPAEASCAIRASTVRLSSPT
jgi:hypothetical protein